MNSIARISFLSLCLSIAASAGAQTVRQYVLTPGTGSLQLSIQEVEQPEPADPIVCHALVQDISLGGLKVQCHDFVAVNTPVKINLPLPESRRYLNLHGKVRWVRSLFEGESYEYGLQFEDISPQNIQHLIEHLFGN